MDAEFNSVAMVSCAWVLLAYLTMPLGPTAGLTGRSSGQQLWGQRSFLNMIEQAPLFLTSLWSFALVVSAERAASLGWNYIVLRSLYSPVWLVFGGENGVPLPHMLPVTFSQYGLNIFFGLSVVLKEGFDVDLQSFFMGSDNIAWAVLTVGFMAYAVGLISQVNIALTNFGLFDKPESSAKKE